VLDCLLLSGHAGVSTDGGVSIYGFNPDATGIAIWKLLEDLKQGIAFPGVVRHDTGVFAAATAGGLVVHALEVVVPDPRFQDFVLDLDAERKQSQYSYGFPNGDGDCNCITWLERLGLPLLTGGITEFMTLLARSPGSRRRFGLCV
jgi:hypothetical protein